jgi:hypothetical protein
MLTSLVRFVSPEDFAASDMETQVAMYETLLGSYSAQYLPEWMQVLHAAILNQPGAIDCLLGKFACLADFAVTYLTQLPSIDQWAEEMSYEEQCAAEEYYTLLALEPSLY